MNFNKKAKSGNEVPADITEEGAPAPVENTEAAENAEVAENAEIAAAAAAGVLENGEEVPAPAPQAADGKPPVYGDKVLTKAQQRKRSVIRWVILIFGIVMMSCSVYFFQTPNDITLGGIAGVAVIINSFLPDAVKVVLTQGVIMAIINILLLILGLIILGKQCTVRTIFCSLFYTAFIWLFEYFHVIEHINQAVGNFTEAGEVATTLTNQPLLELVYAILLFGIGGALVFNCGASSGGTDIIALILKKFTNINVGMALMIIDMIVVCISFYTFSSVSAGLFSVLGLFTKSFLLDGVIESMGKTKYLTIITENPEKIAEYILKVINHGYTMYDAEGGYTHKKKKVLVTVCKRSEALKIKMKIHNEDPTSFVIITDANEILGKGFGGTI
ncbi:MAG: YitT family protein [Clostridia bacterium]|nr:YitT family protein [Clostridia bacterium]